MYLIVNLTHNLEGYKADPKLVLLVKLVHTIMKALELVLCLYSWKQFSQRYFEYS